MAGPAEQVAGKENQEIDITVIMINSKQDMTEKINIDEVYGIDRDAISEQARANLSKNRQYSKLYDEMNRLDRKCDLVKIGILESRMRLMESREMDRLAEVELNRRKDVNRLADLLKEKDTQEYEQYQTLMAALSLLLDMTDNIFFDLNKLLRRNNIGIEMDNFPELKVAKKTVQSMAIKEQYSMERYKEDLWNEESERLYKYVLERCATYRRKVERIEAKMERTEKKA